MISLLRFSACSSCLQHYEESRVRKGYEPKSLLSLCQSLDNSRSARGTLTSLNSSSSIHLSTADHSENLQTPSPTSTLNLKNRLHLTATRELSTLPQAVSANEDNERPNSPLLAVCQTGKLNISLNFDSSHLELSALPMYRSPSMSLAS